MAYSLVLITISILSSSSINRVLDTGFQLKTQDHISKLVIEKSSKLPYHFYADSQYFNTLHFVQSESVYRPTQLATAVRGLISQGLMLFSLSVLFSTLHWSIGLILIAISIPMGLVKYIHTKKLVESRLSIQEVLVKKGLKFRKYSTAKYLNVLLASNNQELKFMESEYLIHLGGISCDIKKSTFENQTYKIKLLRVIRS